MSSGSGFPYKVYGSMAILAASSATVTYAIQKTRKKSTAINDAAMTGVSSLSYLAAWELGWWLYRRNRRAEVYKVANWASHNLNRPLVVIGAPDGGSTSNYGCGNYTIDIAPTTCPNAMQLDVTKPLPFADSSVVVFCSCVLEYLDDPCAAIAEIKRISGGYAYYVGVEPWTLTALYYPGAKQTMAAKYR
jgi:Methyltransferase domain